MKIVYKIPFKSNNVRRESFTFPRFQKSQKQIVKRTELEIQISFHKKGLTCLGYSQKRAVVVQVVPVVRVGVVVQVMDKPGPLSVALLAVASL